MKKLPQKKILEPTTPSFTMLSATLMLTAALAAGELGQNGRPHGPSSFGTCTFLRTLYHTTPATSSKKKWFSCSFSNSTFAALHLCLLAVPDHVLDLLSVVNGVPFRTSCESSLLKAEYWCGTGHLPPPQHFIIIEKERRHVQNCCWTVV